MVIGEIGEIEPSSIDQPEPLSDKEFVEKLVARLLPTVEDAYKVESEKVAGVPEHGDLDAIPISRQIDLKILPFGGNDNEHHPSGLSRIKVLRDELRLMNNPPIDLQKIDYTRLKQVLNFLTRHEPNGNWGEDLNTLQNIETGRDQSFRSKAA